MTAKRAAVVIVLGGLVAWTFPSTTLGQCTLYQVSALPGVCDGYLNVTCGPGIDSILWSNGQVFDQGSCNFYGPVGSYTYQAYDNGSVTYSGWAAIESHGWEIDFEFVPPLNGGPAIFGSASLYLCGSTTNEHPCCAPGLVEGYLVQDDTLITQDHCVVCSQTYCALGVPLWFSDLDFGHTYSVQVVDSLCAGVVQPTLPPIIVPSCANLTLDTVVIPSIPGLSTGSIELLEAVPDTTEPYPIYAPVAGTITLYQGLTGFSVVGAAFLNALNGSWSALDTGFYRLQFAPDAGCQIAMDTIYVPTVLNVSDTDPHVTAALSLSPSITDATLMLYSSNSAERISITVRDACGRTVLETSAAPGPFSVERLVPGPYFLTAVQGREELRARFIKR